MRNQKISTVANQPHIDNNLPSISEQNIIQTNKDVHLQNNQPQLSVKNPENVIVLPALVDLSNCIISNDNKHVFITPSVTGTALEVPQSPALTLHEAQPSQENEFILADKLSLTDGNISPEIDPEKIIMDLDKSTEWGDISSVKEIVVSPQLDILELQWSEIINKQSQNLPSGLESTQETQIICSATQQSDAEIPLEDITLNSHSPNINLSASRDIVTSSSSSTSTEDISLLWSNVENNNYVLQDAVGLLGSNSSLNDSVNTNVENKELLPREEFSQSKLDKSTNTNNGCKTETSINKNDKAVNECKCKVTGKKVDDCCVTVCLKTLNSLRKVLESGCCKNNFLESSCCKSTSMANNSLTAIALQMATTANCCSGN